MYTCHRQYLQLVNFFAVGLIPLAHLGELLALTRHLVELLEESLQLLPVLAYLLILIGHATGHGFSGHFFLVLAVGVRVGGHVFAALWHPCILA